MTLRLAVTGARGRMGSAVVRIAKEQGYVVVHEVDRGDVARLASGGYDVAVDFSSADGARTLFEVIAGTGAAIVSGTTGLPVDAEEALRVASTRVPVLWEPNMSVGVHVLGALVRDAVRVLGDDFDIEIVETHHRKKVDAPSGTALRLAALASEARANAALVHGRHGRPGPRAAGEVGLHAVRGGDVIGDHSVHLLGDGERIELSHRATTRDVFARGALRAAAWIAKKPAGLYALRDVIA